MYVSKIENKITFENKKGIISNSWNNEITWKERKEENVNKNK